MPLLLLSWLMLVLLLMLLLFAINREIYTKKKPATWYSLLFFVFATMRVIMTF
jgi:hypothetical protein